MKKPSLGLAIISLLAVSLVATATVIAIRKYVSRKISQAEVMRLELQDEMDKIEHPSTAIRIQHNSNFKVGQGNIADYYKTRASYDEIRSHYDSELAKHGWQFREESKLSTWGKDLGESERFYCKGSVSADIYFTGQRENELGYRYSFGLSWGLDSCR
jgi:hypothetical protein